MSDVNLQSRVKILDNAVHHGGARPADPSLIVWHGTEGDSAMSSIEYLNTTTDKSASYTYVIERDGIMYRMTSPALVAWHAGDSAWPHPVVATAGNQKPNGGRSVNAISLGVAFANKGDGEPLTLEQRASGLWLAKVYIARFDIPIALNLIHAEVSPGRKTDTLSFMTGDQWRAALTEYMAR